MYYSASGLFKLLDDIHFGNGSDESAHDDDYILKCDLLIIDDLGTEFYNRFTVSSLFTIINERGLCNKSTIISTNLSLKQFEDQYSERILSRINQYYQFFSLFGADLREPWCKIFEGMRADWSFCPVSVTTPVTKAADV